MNSSYDIDRTRKHSKSSNLLQRRSLSEGLSLENVINIHLQLFQFVFNALKALYLNDEKLEKLILDPAPGHQNIIR